jgi:hypothetical protein
MTQLTRGQRSAAVRLWNQGWEVLDIAEHLDRSSAAIDAFLATKPGYPNGAILGMRTGTLVKGTAPPRPPRRPPAPSVEYVRQKGRRPAPSLAPVTFLKIERDE